jgi:hypothetical protein
MALKMLGKTEIRTAQPIVPELSAFEVEMAIEKLKRHKSPGIDQIPVLTKPVVQNMPNFRSKIFHINFQSSTSFKMPEVLCSIF